MSDDWKRIAQYDDDRGLLWMQAVIEAAKRGLRIPSTQEHSQRLVYSEKWKSETEMYPCFTGTLAIHEQPGKPFGATVQDGRITAVIPKRFQGMRDMVILCNHPDFKLTDVSEDFMGGTVNVGKSAEALPIPLKSWEYYQAKNRFEFPSGEIVKDSGSNDLRRFWRRDNRPFVGLVVRRYGWGGYYRRYVLCDYDGDCCFGVFGVESKAVKHKHDFVCACGERRK